MKPTNKPFLLGLAFMMAISCDKQTPEVTNADDYDKYLNINENKSRDFAANEIEFWQNKYNSSPNQTAYLSLIASNYSKLFETTGDIKNLYQAEKLLIESNKDFKYTNVGPLRALARNYISQHRFKEALELANKALVIGTGLKEAHKLLFDVQMELGNYTAAKSYLDLLKDEKDFDYLIRIAKWNDHIGDIETTINYMEKAKKIAVEKDNKTLMVWTYSNLGDFYGHAGHIKESYDNYLKTLEIDPNNTYALKGIAWVAFSYEKNTAEAKRIIDIISKSHHTPDFFLLKSEIAEYEKNEALKNEGLKKYFEMLNANNYGAMYNKYNALIFADNNKTASKALEIAKIEVDHRPTPDSYDLLAWSYYNLGDTKKALEIAEKHVAGKSFEPRLNYHLAMIYKANKMNNKIKPIKEELLKSTFELGPNIEQQIKNL